MQGSPSDFSVSNASLMDAFKHPAAEKADLSSVKYCLVAGAPLSVELSKQIMLRMPHIAMGQGYGKH